MRVLGISGSLRRDSHNSALLRAAGELIEEQGAEFEVYDGLKAIPPYDEDDDVGEGPAAVAGLRRAIARADAVLFATPEYNASIPGVLKNAVDWASRPRADSALLNKTVTVTGASTGQFGALWAQNDLRRILGIAGARVVGEAVPVARAGEGFDEELHGRLRTQLQLLVEVVQPDEVAA